MGVNGVLGGNGGGMERERVVVMITVMINSVVAVKIEFWVLAYPSNPSHRHLLKYHPPSSNAGTV
jgi:hypothetical protein